MIKRALIIIAMLLSSTILANAAESAPEDDIKAGEQIYDTYCADACHQAPAAGRLKPKQWRIVLNTMQTRMQGVGMQPLTEEQLRQVLAYLTQGM